MVHHRILGIFAIRGVEGFDIREGITQTPKRLYLEGFRVGGLDIMVRYPGIPYLPQACITITSAQLPGIQFFGCFRIGLRDEVMDDGILLSTVGGLWDCINLGMIWG